MTAERTLLILDSVAAARAAFARQMPGNDFEVLSTRPSVVDFLAARGVEARDFSDFISTEQAGAAIRDASSDLDARLARLDDTLGARMCAAGGLPKLALFQACFKYLAQYTLAGLGCFERILADRLVLGEIGAVRFHHALATSNDPVFSFVAAARRICKQHGAAYAEFEVHRSVAARLVGTGRRAGSLALRALKAPGRVPARVMRKLNRWRASQGSNTAPIAFLFDPGDVSFFEGALSSCGMRVLCVKHDGIASGSDVTLDAARPAAQRMQVIATEWLQSQSPGVDHDLDRLFVSYVVRHASSLLLPLSHAHLCLQSQPVGVAAWDAPPVTTPQLNLLLELFLNSSVPVLGRQHGANYVDQDLGGIHFDSDFNRCTHYFSYGFGAEEFAATYPARRPRCTFIPAGNPPPKPALWARSVDIVFPITSGGSLFHLARMPESELARRQSRILEAMEARQDLRCVVKPPPKFGDDEFGHAEALRKLRHVRVARSTWTEYLERWRPRLIVMEVASTPLFEALSLDVDIFLMLDPLFPFTDAALAMLRKRVHVFSTTEELAQAIQRYGLDSAPRLRDQAYYRTYVNRGSAEAVFDLLKTPALTLDCKAAS